VLFRGLKTKIAFNLAILFFVAMLLINIVTVMTAQRDIVRKEVARGQFILSALEGDLLKSLSLERGPSPSISRAEVNRLLTEAGVSDAEVLGENNQQVSFGSSSKALQEELTKSCRKVMRSKKQEANFYGATWGVFWKQPSDLVLSSPLLENDRGIAAVSIVLPLKGIYRSLRQSQKMLFIYLVINTAILTFIGIYRLSKVYFQPLTRLARRAEDYREDDEMLFSVRKEDNELHRLSGALNSMLRRISADKEKLRATVNSLEAANVQLKKAQNEIIRAEKLASAGRLSAGIAHEIGNPIGIVMGYLELLKQKDIPDAEKREYIHRTEEEIERINTIIRQLLEISRPSTGGLKVVSVHDLIDDIAQVLSVQPLMSNLELEYRLEAQNDRVLADANQLRQVFLNLIINAADAISSSGKADSGKLLIQSAMIGETPAQPYNDAYDRQDVAAVIENPGRLRPAARYQETQPQDPKTYLEIRFIDNGPGIAEENISNIFDPFFTTKEPGKGTGLGLSVSFMIVEGFGGQMSVDSKFGEGTSMTLRLPVFECEVHAVPNDNSLETKKPAKPSDN
jgi:two-component system NtrC family sensor kinase